MISLYSTAKYLKSRIIRSLATTRNFRIAINNGNGSLYNGYKLKIFMKLEVDSN